MSDQAEVLQPADVGTQPLAERSNSSSSDGSLSEPAASGEEVQEIKRRRSF